MNWPFNVLWCFIWNFLACVWMALMRGSADRKCVDLAEVWLMILKEAFLLWVLWNLHEIHFLELTQRAAQQHRLDTSFLLSLSLFFFQLVISFMSSPSHNPSSHPHRSLPSLSPLSVEVPLGEFSSRRILRNENKLLTRRGKTLLGGTKKVCVTRDINNLATPTHRHAQIFLVILSELLMLMVVALSFFSEGVSQVKITVSFHFGQICRKVGCFLNFGNYSR